MKPRIQLFTFLASFGLASTSFGAETTVNYPSDTLPYTGSTSSLEANISGNTNGARSVVGVGAEIGDGNDAVTINYIEGTTLHYLSTLAGGFTGTVNGNVNINITGGTFNNQTSSPSITEAVLGTAYGKSTATINGNVTITIDGGDFHGNIFAGGGATVTGNTNLVINGGTFKSEDGIFGGNSWGGVTQGDTSIKITGGDFTQTNIYAGNHRGNPDSFSQNEIQGSASLVIEGGTFGNINGGSSNGRDVAGKVREAGLIKGNTSIEIKAGDESAITINGDINVSSGIVAGDANVAFVGNGDNLIFNGNINVAKPVEGDNAAGSLIGNASISIGTANESFSGEFNAQITEGFALLEIANAGTSVTFTNAFNVSTLSVDSDVISVNLMEATTFSTLNIVFADNFETGAVLSDFQLADIFGSSTAMVEGLLTDGSFTVTNGSGQAFVAIYGANGSIEVGDSISIPEPSSMLLISFAACGLIGRRRHKTVA